MKRTGFDFLSPTRRSASGLKRGEAAHDGPSNFRVFYECTNPNCPGPKKRGLPMHLDWPALSAYPHKQRAIQGGLDQPPRNSSRHSQPRAKPALDDQPAVEASTPI